AKHMGIISSELAAQLAPGVGLRNRLVHEYEEIDHAKVYAGLSRSLDLLPQYVAAIEAYLTTLSIGGQSS
ncbi:MAG: DUF86 domain-containing protein, partial [Anaerolineales bacterium]